MDEAPTPSHVAPEGRPGVSRATGRNSAKAFALKGYPNGLGWRSGRICIVRHHWEIPMKALLAIALAAGATLAASSPADARQGCGHGFHRGPYGHCRPN